MTDQQQDLRELGMRIKGLREACDVTDTELAKELGIELDRYRSFEETGADVPISVIYSIARKFGVEFTEILMGKSGKLESIQVVRKGEGRKVDRFAGYHFQDLAWRYNHKIMQPLLVTLDPKEHCDDLISHGGQEFNMVLEGAIDLSFDGQAIRLNAGDSAYFNANIPHGQKCASPEPAVFVTVITE
ncbi:MAG: cupin domain-containing protein [Coriobacteriia bacterium]|nr:cupin domain-containing protein [Coriobacteriia bacterium]MCL2536710.1 cupin domain-containing protein [Coriobacteriia bacterium]